MRLIEFARFASQQNLFQKVNDLFISLKIYTLLVSQNEGDLLVEVLLKVEMAQWKVTEKVGKADYNVASLLLASL